MATAKGYTEQLWARGGTGDQFLLVIETDIVGRVLPEGSAVPLTDISPLRQALNGARPEQLSSTRVMMLRRPTELATEAITTNLGCTKLEARTYIASIVSKMGGLADANGERVATSYLGLSTSDTRREFDRLGSVLQSSQAIEAVNAGLCEAVEFVVENNDASFYLGVDGQPEHGTADWVVERPQLREGIIDALSDRRNALIRGPSGAGKSALLWEVAHASRHTVRWFRVRRLSGNQVHLLMRLVDSCMATANAPVGFVLDDGGAGLTEGWSAPTREPRSRVDVVVLSSVREEHVALLSGRSSAVDVALVNDEATAERIWSKPRARGQTSWQGWKEAWAQSKC